MKVTDAERALFLMTPIEFNAYVAAIREPEQPRLMELSEFMRENRTDS